MRIGTLFLGVVLGVIVAAGVARADTLYAVDGAGGASASLYEIDPTDGSVVQTIGSTGFSHVTGLAVDPTTGVLYGWVSGTGLITIDTSTGAGTLVGSGNAIQVPDLAFDASGTLYGWYEPHADDLLTIDTSTGASTDVGDAGISTLQTGLAVAPDGTIYVKTDYNVYSVNPTTGATSFVKDLDRGMDNILAYDSTGTLFTGLRNGNGGFDLYTADLSTGATTYVGTNDRSNLSALAFAVTPVPEPSTLALLGLGGVLLGGFGLRSRRRRAEAV